MVRRSILVAGLVILTGLGLLRAKDKNSWWDEPFTSWNQAQTAKMFNESPWVQMQTYSSESVQGALGQNETKYQFTVRLFSAQPIRDAYVRMLQLMNNYDTLPPERRQEFDSRVSKIASVDPGDEVVVAVAYACSDPQGSRDLKRFLDTATTATLSQSAFLYTSSAGQIALEKYLPPDAGIGSRFIYPRTFKGQPILQATDKEMRFQISIPQVGQDLIVGFKPAKMVYKGKSTY
ncbi:MAG TPA: hypothetical protein VG204_18145 [Terriglobia bacterium]|nr:hypothetical protein [Terriglobia bacterium]